MTTYIIKVILCSALFVFTYRVLLEKEKMLRFNRFYLLSGLLLSFVIPTITLSSSSTVLPGIETIILNKNFLPDNGTIHQSSTTGIANYIFSIFLAIYVTITTLLFFRFIHNLKKILNKARKNPAIPYKNSKIILINEDLTPHSFLNYLFINKEEYKNGNIEDEVLAHEYAHVQQKHSYDILIMEVFQIFFWLNPFLFLYRKAIELNHEFLADEAVITTYRNITMYQYLLIDKASKRQTFILTSQFNYSITKKRLIMMTKTKSLRNALCRQIAIIPVLTIAIFLFSTKTFAQDSLSAPKTKQNAAPLPQKGVSPELLNEYEQIVNKTKDKTGFPVFSKFSNADKSRLKTIYLCMSKEQQAKQIVTFIPVDESKKKYFMVIPMWGKDNTSFFEVIINEKPVN